MTLPKVADMYVERRFRLSELHPSILIVPSYFKLGRHFHCPSVFKTDLLLLEAGHHVYSWTF